MTGEVDGGEEQVAELVFEGVRRGWVGAGGKLGLEFGGLFAELVDEAFGVGPVEADAGGAGAELACLDHRRHGAGDIVEKALGGVSGEALLFAFDGIPGLLDGAGGLGGGVAENMGVTADELGRKARRRHRRG